MPATVSPVPFRSATPRRRSGPSVTVPTSRTRTATPLSFRVSTISPISATDFAYPRPRTMYSAPVHGEILILERF